jgi:23S rRNA maturation-related 3'-5' exoribonuclease YhaM
MDSQIEEVFPELDEIEDDELRQQVVRSYEITIEEGEFDPLTDAPWGPHFEEAGDQRLVTHVREVVAISIAVTDCMMGLRRIDVNRDYVVAGALVHDISKFFEYAGDTPTNIRNLLVHPHFCVYVLEKANIPVEVQHIAISHTGRSSIKPNTMEARIVSKSDWLAAESIYWETTGDVNPAH